MHVEPSILSIQLPFVWLHAEAHNEVDPIVNLINFGIAFVALWFLFAKFNVFGFIGKQQEQIRKEIEA
ncbi:MAG: hypothetical protein K2X66_06765, partial [Cyanobacteria bacterium]|nr:hypothetical protein [Cyanobacteriota bacterium]